MHDAMIRLFSAVQIDAVPTNAVPAGGSVAFEPVPFGHVAALNAEVATLGYSFDAALMNALAELDADAFGAQRLTILQQLMALTGADVSHPVLFNRFPYVTPEHQSYLRARVIGYVQNRLATTADHWQMLSCGHVIDPALFDLADFGACPICQRQVPNSGLDGLFAKLESPDRARYPFEQITPLKRLTLADAAFVAETGARLLARQSSLSLDERGFLSQIVGRITAFPDTVYRENLPFVFSIAPRLGSLYLTGVTDVLRIACYLSNPAADLSLATPTKFKLRTAHKKALLRLVESCDNIAPDMLRHREMWLRLGERLQPGTAKNTGRYPKAAAAFDRLRNAPGGIETFTKVFEQKIRARTIDSRLIAMMQTRPGEYIRHLDVMIRDANDPALVLDGLRAIVDRVNTRLLFDILKYLSFRDNRQPMRVFIPKGPANRVRTLEDRREPIATDLLVTAIAIVQDALTARFKGLAPMGRVYIHPSLFDMLLPFNRRGDSTTSMSVVKGSRYKLDDTEVVRMFVHWTGRDVDLSVLYYDADMASIGTVSFRRTHDEGVIHSGDIQRAQNGASEFIDIHIPTLLNRGVRYVVASVLSYSGEPFSSFPCFTGFMARDGLRSGKRFEPASVTIKMDITANTRSAIPFMFDLVDRTVIYLDMTGRVGRYAYVDQDDTKFVETAQAIMSLPRRKPTIGDVLVAHVVARGRLVAQPEQADKVFLADVNVDDISAEYAV